MRRSRNRGFTIVELLVVITILGMLMAMLLPAVSGVRARARQTQCTNNQYQIARAALTAATQDAGTMPNSMEWWLGADRNDFSSEQWHSWVPPLLTALGRDDIASEIFDAIQDGQNPREIKYYLDFLVCPSDPPDTLDGAPLSYVVNGGYVDNLAVQNNPRDWQANGAWSNPIAVTLSPINQTPLKISLSYIASHDGTARTILLGENVNAEEWNRATIQEHHTALLWQDDPETSIAPFNDELEVTLTNRQARPSSRHDGGFVLAFCDGSVEFISNQIDPQTYARLMSSNGREAAPPGSDTTINWQTPAFKQAELEP